MDHFTRIVQVWLANDEGIYSSTCEARDDIMAELVASANYSAGDVEALRQDAAQKLGEWIENTLCGCMPTERGLWGDLIRALLEQIDFEEVATDFLEGCGWLYLTANGEPAQTSVAFADNECDLCQALEDSLGELSEEDSSTLWNAKTGEPFTINGVTYLFNEV